MRRLILLLALAPVGCPRPSTEVAYDPATGKAEFSRGWLGGPVDTGLSVTKPDGTQIDFWWKSDVDLSSAESVSLAREDNLKAAIARIPVATP